MNVQFYPFSGHTTSLLKENFFTSLTPLTKKISAIAAIVFALLITLMLVLRIFKKDYAKKFDHLQTQLVEIFAALHDKDLLGALYACGTTSLVYTKTLAGKAIEKGNKVWNALRYRSNPHSLDSALESILNPLFDQAVDHAFRGRQHRLWHHMRQIEQIWKRVPTNQENLEQRDRYVTSLANELNGSVWENKDDYVQDFDKRAPQPLKVNEENNHQQMITHFHHATAVFWSIFFKNKHQDLRKPLEPFLKATSTLADQPLYRALKNERRWLQVEEAMQMPIPVALFSKLHDPDSLSVDEEEHLQKWVETLNKCQKTISLKLLSIVLKEVFAIIHMQGYSPVTMQELLLWIDKQGCSILHCEDPSHMDWREKLQPGDKVTCNGKELILGNQLSPDKSVDDECKVFELANHPDQVVKIANNRFRLLIEATQAQNEEEHYGFRFVETIANIETDPQLPAVDGLDQDGLCIVLEKLSLPLSSHDWTSDAAELTAEDEKVALVLANHLFCMHQWFANAQNLSLPHLMFDKEGLLKSARLLKKGTLNYNELEEHCVNAAKDNPHVLTFLMNVSKLGDHVVAKYYRDAVAYTLNTGETDLISRPLPLGHREPFYDKRVSELCDQAIELRRTTLQNLIALQRKKGEKEKDLQKKVAERLVYFYSVSPTPGILSDKLQQQVLDSFSDPNWQEPALDPDESTYYDEKYDLMMSYNNG